MTAQLFLYVNLFVWFIPILTTSTTKNKIIYTGLLVATSAISIFWSVAALISVLAGFVAIAISLNEQHFPSTKNKEEETYSREFWMFVGSLVLFLSAMIISVKTSVPVFNKLFGTKIAPPEDPEFAHNQVQVFVALIIGILTAITQFLKYKSTNTKAFYKNIAIPTIIALVISTCISLFGNINYDKFGYGFLAAIHLAIFASVYAVVANAFYIVDNLKGKIKNAGASIAHIGFGLVLLGILISSSKKAVLSWNTTGIAIFKKSKQEDPAENITLFKGVRTDMKTHHVTYQTDSFNAKDKKKYFKLLFEDKATNEKFFLYPDALKANKGQEGYSFNPDKKHYWHKDIFVYVTSFIENKIADTIAYKNANIKVGDTIFYGNGQLVLEAVNKDAALLKKKLPTAEAGMFLQLKVINKEKKQFSILPGVGITKQGIESLPDTLISQAMTIKFNKIVDEANGTFEIGIKESDPLPELITLKVYNFPMINILWIGIIVMVFGFLMSAWKRGFSQK
jgi:cytochrome c-type biogenesis protein CcmF